MDGVWLADRWIGIGTDLDLSGGTIFARFDSPTLAYTSFEHNKDTMLTDGTAVERGDDATREARQQRDEEATC